MTRSSRFQRSGVVPVGQGCVPVFWELRLAPDVIAHLAPMTIEPILQLHHPFLTRSACRLPKSPNCSPKMVDLRRFSKCLPTKLGVAILRFPYRNDQVSASLNHDRILVCGADNSPRHFISYQCASDKKEGLRSMTSISMKIVRQRRMAGLATVLRSPTATRIHFIESPMQTRAVAVLLPV